MKSRLITLACLVGVVLSANAQTTKIESSKSPRTKATPTKATQPPPALAATGPTGMGAIKLGMSRDAVLAVPESDPVHIVGELTPKVDKEPKPGIDRFEGKFVGPGATTAAKVTLTFEGDSLTSIVIPPDDENAGLAEALAKQIADRYGAGAVKDDRKDEQCIYRNGNNFTLKSGAITTSWTTPLDGGGTATTALVDVDFNVCPSSLRSSMIGIKMKSLRIGRDKQESAQKSIF